MKQNPHKKPVKIGLRTRLNLSISKIMHNIPSNIPICEPKPSANNMVKNSTAQKEDPGNSTIACVKTVISKLKLILVKINEKLTDKSQSCAFANLRQHHLQTALLQAPRFCLVGMRCIKVLKMKHGLIVRYVC